MNPQDLQAFVIAQLGRSSPATEIMREFGAPGKIRTYGLLLRRQTLYPD